MFEIVLLNPNGDELMVLEAKILTKVMHIQTLLPIADPMGIRPVQEYTATYDHEAEDGRHIYRLTPGAMFN